MYGNKARQNPNDDANHLKMGNEGLSRLRHRNTIHLFLSLLPDLRFDKRQNIYIWGLYYATVQEI